MITGQWIDLCKLPPSCNTLLQLVALIPSLRSIHALLLAMCLLAGALLAVGLLAVCIMLGIGLLLAICCILLKPLIAGLFPIGGVLLVALLTGLLAAEARILH